MDDMLPCKPCDGSGQAVKGISIPCETCGGRGTRPRDPRRTDRCGVCSGKGQQIQGINIPCSRCDGYGWLYPIGEEGPVAGPLVWYVEAGKPYTSRILLADVLSTLNGHVRVCDPYYGRGTLAGLALLQHCTSIKFLTRQRATKDRSVIDDLVRGFLTEFGQFEFRQRAQRDVHDRFILAENELVVLGHGLQDVGGKESFMVRLDESVAGDAIRTVAESFDAKWAEAEPLPE